ncbi:hypothetical protein SK128_002508 [Halocaridina rubra]|uniref:Gustatory receptor n=1 Tax=Halocaridina rubra TaxID=373956 RepID=A0AAN9FX13_HALRR
MTKLSEMKVGCCSLIRFLFLVMKIVGGFPYNWQSTHGRLDLKRSVLATLWSAVLMIILMASAVLSIIFTPMDINTGKTAEISACILNYVTYSIMFAFFPYFIMRSGMLAVIIQKMTESKVDITRKALCFRKDYFQLVYITLTAIAFGYLNYDAITECLTTSTYLTYKLSASVCDFVVEIMVTTLSVLLYLLLKILSTEAEKKVNSMSQALVSSPSDEIIDESTKKPQIMNISQWVSDFRSKSYTYNNNKHREKEKKYRTVIVAPSLRESIHKNERKICRAVAHQLMSLDEVVLNVVDYAGPLVAMILLSSTVNATTMLYLTSQVVSYYYMAYISLKIVCVVNITCVSDSLWRKKNRCLKQVRRLLTSKLSAATEQDSPFKAGLMDVERVLINSPEFHVCRLFTLNRRILLPVAHAVVTYLVIALQFGSSEKPNQNTLNCTTEG